jgi:hypothetical protein
MRGTDGKFTLCFGIGELPVRPRVTPSPGYPLRSGRHLPPRNTHYQAAATTYLGRTCTGSNRPACLAHRQHTYRSDFARRISILSPDLASENEVTVPG